MCQKESWGAIFATTEAHSTQRGQPPRMHGPGLWMHEQKEQRVTPVPVIGVNCNLWCPGWDGKDLGGRPEYRRKMTNNFTDDIDSESRRPTSKMKLTQTLTNITIISPSGPLDQSGLKCSKK